MLLCLAGRGDDKTPQVVDVVPAKDPIRFLEERYEFSSEEISRRRAAMKAAEEEAQQHKAHIGEQRHRLEQEHEEKVRVALKARQQLDGELQAVEAEQVFKHKFESEMADARRHSKAILEQGELVNSLILLQDDLRKKEEERLAQEFLEQVAEEQAQREQLKRVKSKARQIADSINNAPAVVRLERQRSTLLVVSALGRQRRSDLQMQHNATHRSSSHRPLMMGSSSCLVKIPEISRSHPAS